METLKPNMYVRTNDGYIAKIKEIEANERLHLYLKAIYTDNYKIDMVLEDEITKVSHNIIDLIEVGDYVNGYYVTTGNQGVGSIYIAEIDGLGLKKKLYENDIKTIVTKQQMESMQYKVK